MWTWTRLRKTTPKHIHVAPHNFHVGANYKNNNNTLYVCFQYQATRITITIVVSMTFFIKHLIPDQIVHIIVFFFSNSMGFNQYKG